jgi:hypothetical protein
MRFKTKIKLCLWKRYFDTGLGLTNYIKYFILFFGVASRDVISTLLIAFLYGLASLILGWYWLNSDFYKADTELSNQYNLFVEQMRKKIGLPNNRKI